MKVRPMHDRVLIKRIEEKKAAKAGIIIPDTANRAEGEEGPGRGCHARHPRGRRRGNRPRLRHGRCCAAFARARPNY